MESHFKDKVAFITGAGSGMGQALSVRLAQFGATVVITDVSPEGLEKTRQIIEASHGKAIAHSLDVTDRIHFEELLRATKEQQGSLDFIFNNAGIAIIGEVRDMPREDWDRVIEINQTGVLNGTLAAYQIMLTQGSGHIVNTASIAGLVPAPILTAYGMTKHAVVGLTLSLREEAEALGVKASVVCPGIVKTGIAKGQYSRGFDPVNPFQIMEESLPIKPVPAHIAAEKILAGVAKNKAKIIFPFNASFGVWATHAIWYLHERVNQRLLRYFREHYRNQ